MPHEKKPEGFFDALTRIVQGSSSIVKDVSRIALLEFRIARLSALYIAIWSFLALIFFSAVWLCLQAVLILAINQWVANLLVSFAIVFGINLLFLLIAVIVIVRISRNINFATTHKQLKLLK